MTMAESAPQPVPAIDTTLSDRNNACLYSHEHDLDSCPETVTANVDKSHPEQVGGLTGQA